MCFALSQSESATKRHLVNSVKGTGPFCLFSLDCGRCSGFGKGAVLHIDGTNRKCIYNRSFEGKETWHGEHFAVNFSIRGYFPNWRARVIITTKTISQANKNVYIWSFPVIILSLMIFRCLSGFIWPVTALRPLSVFVFTRTSANRITQTKGFL